MTDDEKAAAQAEADERYTRVMKAEIARKLLDRIPASIVPVEAYEQVADQFLDFLGRVVEFCEKNADHMTTPRAAALLYFVTQFTPNHVGRDQADVIEALVQGAKAGARELRREAKPS